MQAYHNEPKIKSAYLHRVRAHAKADEIVKGKYWENGKGCAVGCTIHSDQHSAYEIELGIPQILARLEDQIFEGSSEKFAKTWPARFLAAIKPGADLSKVGWKFQHWLLLDPKHGSVRFAHPEDRPLFEKIGGLIWDLALGKQIDKSAARSAAESAWSVWSTGSAESAAESARSAARSAAELAAESAAWSAGSAAESAGSAARSAAESAGSAAESAAWSAAYEVQGEYLLKLLKAAK